VAEAVHLPDIVGEGKSFDAVRNVCAR